MKNLSITYKRKLDKWYDPISDEEILEVFRSEFQKSHCDKIVKVDSSSMYAEKSFWNNSNYYNKIGVAERIGKWYVSNKIEIHIHTTRNERTVYSTFHYFKNALTLFLLMSVPFLIGIIVMSFKETAMNLILAPFVILIAAIITFLSIVITCPSFLSETLKEVLIRHYKLNEKKKKKNRRK